MSSLGCSESFTLHYFGIKGAASTATVVLEQGNIDYEAKGYGDKS